MSLPAAKPAADPSSFSADELVLAVANGSFSAITHAAQTSPLGPLLSQLQHNIRQQLTANHPNPLTRKGCKYFSQNDEDGILLEILKRLGERVHKSFIEFGVEDGLENNTLILLLQNWRGFWCGGQDLAIDIKDGKGRLGYRKQWITRENTELLYRLACSHIGSENIGVFSVDLDGVDYYVAEAVMKAGFHPQIFICEYNGKFPPPIRFCVEYKPDFKWGGRDYMGASLQTFADLLASYDYRLVACNITGGNAFFVKNEFASCFDDVPETIADIFVPANYGLVIGAGHPPSAETINRFI